MVPLPWLFTLHIVVVTDANFAVFGIEKDVAKGDIAITETFSVELSVVVSQLESGCHQRAESRHCTARHQIGDSNKAVLPQGHDVSETGPICSVDQFLRPEKAVAGRSGVYCALQTGAQVRILAQVVREKPFQRH